MMTTLLVIGIRFPNQRHVIDPVKVTFGSALRLVGEIRFGHLQNFASGDFATS